MKIQSVLSFIVKQHKEGNCGLLIRLLIGLMYPIASSWLTSSTSLIVRYNRL